MASYDYRCSSCKKNFELMHGMDEIVTVCPHCGKGPIKKLITGCAGVIFKGSGFYETDYKRKKRTGKEE